MNSGDIILNYQNKRPSNRGNVFYRGGSLDHPSGLQHADISTFSTKRLKVFVKETKNFRPYFGLHIFSE